MQPWEPEKIEPNVWRRWGIGPLQLWARHRQDEWHIASRYEDDTGDASLEAPADEPSGDVPVTRWISNNSDDYLRLVPCAPDRPVVVRPESPLRIPAGGSGDFFVDMPVWVRVTVGEGAALKLIEIPVEILSNTWFGSPEEGELCYALKTPVRRSASTDTAAGARAACELTLRNTSDTELDVQRVCLPATYLALYEVDNSLATDRVRLDYLGEDHGATAALAERGLEKMDAVLLCEPRETAAESVVMRSFGKLFSGGRARH